MRIDRDMLLRELRQAEPSEGLSTEDCNPYLLERVLLPMMRGQTVRIGDVDFSLFDEEDVSAAQEYHDRFFSCSYELRRLLRKVAEIEPQASRKRLFC